MSLNQKSRHKNFLVARLKLIQLQPAPVITLRTDRKIKQGQIQRTSEKPQKERFFERIDFLATS
ncbi:hypothetical protein A1342_19425 [Methylomonas methanica]|uniref:Uncharacterized protein n=1 Tax=Methylomonas denitrificans TaxID=1538553 RepID=A0A140E4W3_9GAMM|nr:hypothetical protein JT25_002850 [Methylomonas denitrificans]OAI01223.1 hypothetical protein A1342_19425 [Methylomonas methanica]